MVDKLTFNLQNTNEIAIWSQYEMNDVEAAVEALKILTATSTARSKMGRFRELVPHIEAAQAAGVSHKNILDTLNKQGLNLSMKAYSVMLFRVRQKVEKVKPVQPLPAKTNTGNVDAQSSKTPLPKIADISRVSVNPVESPIVIPPDKPGAPATFDWERLQAEKPEW